MRHTTELLIRDCVKELRAAADGLETRAETLRLRANKIERVADDKWGKVPEPSDL